MHIAIIMDGNGRWAARRRLPRTAGHRAGAKAVNTVVEAAARRRVGTLTLYAFSAAQLAAAGRRSQWPVRAVQAPPADADAPLPRAVDPHQRHRPPRPAEPGAARADRAQRAGDRALRPACVCASRSTTPRSTASSKPAGACGRQDDIDRSRFVERLAEVDHAALPAPEVDLLIRTGGEKRLSDFLLWECAYAELHFVDCLWPDFDERAFDEALQEYARRERRFGAIDEDPFARSSHG